MSELGWKAFEREAATLFGCKRFWANSGERLDFEAPGYVGQVKLRKTMSLEELTQLAEEVERVGRLQNKIGVVVVRRKRGRGRPSPTLVVVTAAMWEELNGRAEPPPAIEAAGP